MYKNVEEFMAYAESRSHGEKEFHQAVEEVVESLWPFLKITQTIYTQRS